MALLQRSPLDEVLAQYPPELRWLALEFFDHYRKEGGRWVPLNGSRAGQASPTINAPEPTAAKQGASVDGS